MPACVPSGCGNRTAGPTGLLTTPMTSDFDDQNGTSSLSDLLSGRQPRADTRDHVAVLATEVLHQVARRAVDIRQARDRAAVKSAALALTTGSEEAASAALESLDDPLHGLDWFLAERLGPIAKEIGTLWTADKVSFLEATVGASRIYSYLRYRRRPPLVQERGVRKSATFVLVPGDMHSLGISAATDVFRARGWDITLLIGQSHEELTHHFESSQDVLFGFSAGSPVSLEPLARLVVALTVARPAASVLVSGQIATAPESVLALPGVDFCDADLETAAQWFETHTAAKTG